eukprot:TRINITY_DN823_c0_g1_i1.p4 TRINITY_DN823_c0_g1~~TRINITY_DN823_c0_g1_i1.p4  ORF type:complete len:215 (-),score=-2.31 TRINITY_DN823_c0_g1_i1:517-1161(-)
MRFQQFFRKRQPKLKKTLERQLTNIEFMYCKIGYHFLYHYIIRILMYLIQILAFNFSCLFMTTFLNNKYGFVNMEDFQLHLLFFLKDARESMFFNRSDFLYLEKKQKYYSDSKKIINHKFRIYFSLFLYLTKIKYLPFSFFFSFIQIQNFEASVSLGRLSIKQLYRDLQSYIQTNSQMGIIVGWVFYSCILIHMRCICVQQNACDIHVQHVHCS